MCPRLSARCSVSYYHVPPEVGKSQSFLRARLLHSGKKPDIIDPKGGMELPKIQESAENYLETILVLKERNGTVRSVDIAAEMGFS